MERVDEDICPDQVRITIGTPFVIKLRGNGKGEWEERTFTLVKPPDTASPEKGTVSADSALGKALLQKPYRLGTEHHYEAPSGTRIFKLINTTFTKQPS